MSVANVDGFKFPWPFPKSSSTWYCFKSRVTMTVVYLCAKALFGGNKLIVHNREIFLKHLEDRSRSLLTISNHRCNIDDPLIWAIIPMSSFFKNIDNFRYTPTAHDICFTNALHTYWFSLGRCVPVVRGAGVFQECVDFCIGKLNEKKWVHMYPEGKVTVDPLRIKWGIGRMINETTEPPILLPIWVKGMDRMWPSKPPYYPTFGQTVEVIVGEPIDTKLFLAQITTEVEIERRKYLADCVQNALFSLGQCKPIEK